jgi:hypothetical protein
MFSTQKGAKTVFLPLECAKKHQKIYQKVSQKFSEATTVDLNHLKN